MQSIITLQIFWIFSTDFDKLKTWTSVGSVKFNIWPKTLGYWLILWKGISNHDAISLNLDTAEFLNAF
jgi:hypothetical protein